MTTPFLDVPVYRLGEAEYYRRRDEFVEKRLAPLRTQLGERIEENRSLIGSAHQHLIDVYGGCWRFNEIVGYIRLHFLGTQVRGEYFAVAKKRLARSRTKRFEWRTHKRAMERDIEQPITDASIQAAVSHYLVRCQRELPRRYVDVSVLDVLASHVRWYDLWKSTNPFTAGSSGERGG